MYLFIKTAEGSLDYFHENERIVCDGFYKSRSSICLAESPTKIRIKTPSSSNEQEQSDLSQTTVSTNSTIVRP